MSGLTDMQKATVAAACTQKAITAVVEHYGLDKLEAYKIAALAFQEAMEVEMAKFDSKGVVTNPEELDNLPAT